jgi:hypothetical protein
VERSRHIRNTSGLERSLGDVLQDPWAPLALALARQGRFPEAWTYWESSLARGVLDEFSAQRLRPLTTEERKQESDLRGQL